MTPSPLPAQQTLARPLWVRGVGLHCGKNVRVRLLPAPPGHGIVFVRADLRGSPTVRAQLPSVVDARLATTLAHGAARVSTVEHLLAALFALNLDNLRIELHGPELPALDGSARPWVRGLRKAGILAQRAPARCLTLREPLTLRDVDRQACIRPSPCLILDVAVDFPHPLIGQQRLSVQADPQGFERELCWARTFGFTEDLQALQAAGLAKGGDLGNAVVFSADGVLNPEGLRAPDEVVRHKILDLMGDLALLGLRLHAHVEAQRPGHAFTHQLLSALMDTPEAWEIQAA